MPAMRILLVSATAFEIRPLLGRISFIEKRSDQWSVYRFKSVEIDLLVPGIGMVQTAFALGRQFSEHRYDLAINAGIAGTFNDSLAIGSVVNVTEDCVAELGAEDGDRFLSVFDLGLADPDVQPYRGGKLVNISLDREIILNLNGIGSLPGASAITSNTVRGNTASIARIRQIAPADIESMEGAAFFHACLMENLPFLQIRAISNLVEQRDKSRWNLELSLKNLNRVLWDLVTSPSLCR
jgi:futalosine hydrolase